MRDESEIRRFGIEQERKAAKAKAKEKAAREEGAIAQADAYGVLASAYWREANLLRWALGDCESPGGKGCCAHREPQPRRPTVGDYVRRINAVNNRNGQFAKITKDHSKSYVVPYLIKYADGETAWTGTHGVAPATREEYDAAVAAHEAKKAEEAKRAEEDALIGRNVVFVPSHDESAYLRGRVYKLERRGREIVGKNADQGWLLYTGSEHQFFLVPRGHDPEPYAEIAKAAHEAVRHG